MDSVWFKPHWILVDFLDDELAHEKIAELVKGSHYSLDIAGYMVKNEQKKSMAIRQEHSLQIRKI